MNIGIQYRHVHACKICSCRWNCDCEPCQNIGLGECPWCESSRRGFTGIKMFKHDCGWSVGYEFDSRPRSKQECNLCRLFREGQQAALKRDAQDAIDGFRLAA